MKSLQKTKITLIQFPGSNCDQDCLDVLAYEFGLECRVVRHTETDLGAASGVILPGGFSYGDYLRGGALASHAPIMESIQKFAKQGGPIIGICNGFQILTEAKLLPGTLLKNAGQRFICKFVNLKTAAGQSDYHKSLSTKSNLRLPIAHGEGRFHASAQDLEVLRKEQRILLQYCDDSGVLTPEANPNGALDHIAGIVSENGRILGLMPHPERAAFSSLPNAKTDGRQLWQCFIEMCG
ncbi:MAG: phosphoribosylformylglycinamidine synthase subunit PurQ [Oligoflexales bacterium]|nr:phosphoribosylformylglycinamidine synthase subunit PurQ [Oligoflexales bacterium]